MGYVRGIRAMQVHLVQWNLLLLFLQSGIQEGFSLRQRVVCGLQLLLPGDFINDRSHKLEMVRSVFK